MVSVLVTLPGTLAILVNVARLIPVTSLTSERVILRFSLKDFSSSNLISMTIRQCLKDAVLFEGVHYIRPFGGRKILYIWERVEESMLQGISAHDFIGHLE